MGPLTRRPVAVAIVGVAVAVVVTSAVTAVLLRTDGDRTGATQVDFPVNRVHLSASARATGATDAEVEVTFSPTVPGGHLYGSTMPRTGIDGAGRPTLVELASGAWSVAGPAVESVPAHEQVLPGFSAPFPLYPDGPVTLRLPIHRTSADGGPSARVIVTFMVCTSSGVCFPPVERAVVDIPVRG